MPEDPARPHRWPLARIVFRLRWWLAGALYGAAYRVQPDYGSPPADLPGRIAARVDAEIARRRHNGAHDGGT